MQADRAQATSSETGLEMAVEPVRAPGQTQGRGSESEGETSFHIVLQLGKEENQQTDMGLAGWHSRPLLISHEEGLHRAELDPSSAQEAGSVCLESVHVFRHQALYPAILLLF